MPTVGFLTVVAKLAAKPCATTPAAKPCATTPAAKPRATKPAAKPCATTPAAKPRATKPAAKPCATTPAAKPRATKPAAKPRATTPAAKPRATKPAAKPCATTPAAKPCATTPAAKPAPLSQQRSPAVVAGPIVGVAPIARIPVLAAAKLCELWFRCRLAAVGKPAGRTTPAFGWRQRRAELKATTGQRLGSAQAAHRQRIGSDWATMHGDRCRLCGSRGQNASKPSSATVARSASTVAYDFF